MSRGAPRWTSTGAGRCRLEGVAQAGFQIALECDPITCHTQVAPAVDTSSTRIEQRRGHREGIADGEPKLDVELAGERQSEQGGMGDPASDASTCPRDVRHLVLRDQVVQPLGRGADGKCRHGNVVGSHDYLSYKKSYIGSTKT
jgi:hypothetical protein